MQLLRLHILDVRNEVIACLVEHRHPFLGHTKRAPLCHGALRNLLLRSHLWEEQHLLNVCLARHEHHQTVDTNADTTRRRHTVLQRAQEVLIDNHRLIVALVGQAHLFLEPFLLVYRVIKLRISVGQLLTVHHQLETLGQSGL